MSEIQFKLPDEPVFTALCLHEHMFENTESPWAAAVADFQEQEGIAAVRDLTRETAVKIALACDELRSASDDFIEFVNNEHGSYDFGLVPIIADKVAGFLGESPIEAVEKMSVDNFKAMILSTLSADDQAKINAAGLPQKPKVT